MEIILCCVNDQVRERWSQILSKQYTLKRISTLEALAKKINQDEPKMALIHRDLVEDYKENLFREITGRLKVFLLSDRPDVEEGLYFLKLGIVGYANTYSSPGRLNEAVRLILGGSVWVGQQLMQCLILETSKRTEKAKYTPDSALSASLTKRENEISLLVSQGKTNLEIAYDLDITERTVKSHLTSIFTKLGVTSRLNLALLFNRGKG